MNVDPLYALLTEPRGPVQFAWEQVPYIRQGKSKKWIGTGEDAGKKPRYQNDMPGIRRRVKETASKSPPTEARAKVDEVLKGHAVGKASASIKKQAAKTLAALKRHHGDNALHRIRELVEADSEQLWKAKTNRERSVLEKRLLGYREMLQGMTSAEPLVKSSSGEQHGESDRREGSRTTGAAPPETGGSLPPNPEQPGDKEADRGGDAKREPARQGTDERVPAEIGAVNKRLDRLEKLFRKKGQGHVADWLTKLREHVGSVGGEEAIHALGEDLGTGGPEQVQYAGVDTEESPHWASMGDFIESYLNRAGIVPLTGQDPDSSAVILSSQTNKDPWFGRDNYLTEDFVPSETPYNNKLEEAKDLPGLEASEDISKIVGGDVTHVDDKVIEKMNERYGEGQWLIKTYSPDNAFAGFGIFFPQRLKQIVLDAKNTIWNSGQELAKYGFGHLRDEGGKIAGIKHQSGDEYRFGTEQYDRVIAGDVRHWADAAAAVADNEKGALLPNNGKEFMAQPAFPVVGVSEAERASGKTIAPGEGRVHVVVRNGKAEAIPHSTWIKGESLPVVFENDDTKAMAQAAMEAINKLPAKARRGQVYAPDIVKTANGYRVVELNASVEYGGSGYLSDNPFIIDSYVSHLTGRTPAHVRFARKLLTRKKAKAA